jgi:hypothetical protein
LRGFAPKICPTIETTVKNSAERDFFPFAGALGSTHFDVPATQKRAPTKPDNTQTGPVEIR